MTDRWKAGVASAARLLRGYAALMECGELQPRHATSALRNAARLVEEMPAPPMGDKERAELKARVMKAIGVAVDLHDLDDHALYLMRDVGVGGGNSDGEEAAGLIAEAVLTEIGFPAPAPEHRVKVKPPAPLTEEQKQRNESLGAWYPPDPGKLNIPEDRTAYLLRIAAEFIRKHAPHQTVHYDGADCDGLCLSDDLVIEANSHD